MDLTFIYINLFYYNLNLFGYNKMEECIPLTDLKPVIQPIVYTPPITPVIANNVSVVPSESMSFWPITAENWTLWITSFILTILFLVGAYLGARASFFKNLPVKAGEPTWLIAGLWILVSLLSYASFY